MAGADRKRIVIVGGGAAGLGLARKLGQRYGRRRHEVILIDRSRTHIWKPLLHEVAAGALDASLDEVGYHGHCRRWRYRYLYGTLDRIDRAARTVHMAPILDDEGRQVAQGHEVAYDYLVLAYGSITNDFGTDGVAEHCLFLDSRRQADGFRDRLLDQCLRVSRAVSSDPASEARVRIAIVGGGATGVELAAELYNAADGLADYGLETFDRDRMQVTLIEAGPRILPALPQHLADAAREELEALGVRVMTDTPVNAATAEGMKTEGGEFVPADLQVWAAGVRAAPVGGGLDGMETARGGQIVVGPTLQSVTDERVFAIGDCASYTPSGEDKPIPPRAQAAHQMAETAYRNIRALIEGGSLKPFHYRDHGSLVSLSRFSTVGSLMGTLVGGRMAVEGRLARFVYLSLYRMHLIGVHGWFRGAAHIVISHINRLVRPRLKLH